MLDLLRGILWGLSGNAIKLLFPIITFSYVVRTVGIKYFGAITFAQTLISTLFILVDYGYNFFFIKKISQHKNDKHILSYVFHTVLFLKLSLFLITLFLFLMVSPFLGDYLLLCVLFLGVLFGQTILPTWFFHGIQQIRYSSLLNNLIHFILMVLLLSFIKTQSDYWKVPLFYSVAYISVGLFGVFMVYKRVDWVLPSIKNMYLYLRASSAMFVSSVFDTMYHQMPIIMLGAMTNPVQLGYYKVAHSIIQLVQNNFTYPIGQVIYPYLVRYYKKGYTYFWGKFSMLQLALFVAMLILSIGLYYSADWIIYLVVGKNTIYSSKILKFICFSLAFSTAGLSLVQYTNIIAKTKVVMYSSAFLACFYILFAYYYIQIGEAKGLAQLHLIVSAFTFLTCLSIIFFKHTFYKKYHE